MTESSSAGDTLRRKPPPAALRWLLNAIGPGASIESVSSLPGATSSAMHTVDVVDRRGTRRRLVLRRYVNREWLAREPDLARGEANVLRLLGPAEVPAPALVAVDEDGTDGDVPAVLMTWFPGEVTYSPNDMTAWLTGIAAALPSIHAVDGRACGEVPKYRRYYKAAELQAPPWTERADAWKTALGLLANTPPGAKQRFIHRDYHPGNVLWSHGQVSGVIDWVNASWGPPEVDVAHCRLNLVQLYGPEATEQFLDIYRSMSGMTAYHPYWDLNAVANMELLPYPNVYQGWTDAGVTHLTNALMRARLDDFVAGAVARL